MATATPTKPASSVVQKAAATAGRSSTKTQRDTPGLRPNDAKLYGQNMAVMAVVCPRCGAKAGKPCTEPAGLRAPHKARIVKASDDRAKVTTNQAKPGTSGDRKSVAKP
ncbi:MAG: zinc finger domain-containing protein [Solirubrobacteraceae bacterium]